MTLKRIVSEQIARVFTCLCPVGSHKISSEQSDLSILRTQESIAILVPHPDDEVIGCFFLIEEIGSDVPIDLIYVSEQPETTLAQTRRGESLEATNGLVVRDRIWWSLPDGGLNLARSQLRERFLKIRSAYDLVLCPAPWDKTSDHRVIAEEALRSLPTSHLVWYRSTWFTFGLHEASFVVLGPARKKRSALRRYRTQEAIALQNAVSVSMLEAKRYGYRSSSAEAFRLASSGNLDLEPLNVLSIKDLWRKSVWR
jgi:LmbE family N-acetylglucosaminyl deacetylase